MQNDDLNIHLEGTNLHFYEEVTEKTALLFNTYLAKAIETAQWEAVKHDTKPKVTVYINSPGGNVVDGFAMIDAVVASPVKVHTVVTGMAASMGCALALAGHKRFIHSNSVMLIHDVSDGFWGKYFELEDQRYLLKMLRRKLQKQIVQRTKLSKKEVKRRIKRDWWMDAKKALKDGFVDEILGGE